MEPIEKLAKRLQGLQDIKAIQRTLNISRSTAIKYVHYLRKAGFLVQTMGGGKKPRWYRISPVKKPRIGYPGLYEIVNKYSPVKLGVAFEHRIIGRKLTVEEAIVRAIVTKDIRVITSSLALFNHVKNWSRLYRYAKEEKVCRKVGALYDIARTKIRIRRMDKRIRGKLLKAKDEERYIIKYLKSKDFIDIQRKWNVYIPLNKADLGVYDEW